MALYPYQQRVKELVLAGKSVILQAPTGTGKTRAALAPFIEGFFDLPPDRFPRKCIYSVPMRVLANQFYAEYDGLVQTYSARRQSELRVAVQTGETPDDPKLEGDLIFATLDQSLSSALAVPYSLSAGMGNLNAGAFFSSYLVFDEFHLFPSDAADPTRGALATTLELLARTKGLVPFVLMTATFSTTLLHELQRLLDAEVVQVPADEYRQIATADDKPMRQRRFTVVDEQLSVERILAQHRTRSIVVCNQVERARTLFAALQGPASAAGIEVVLLHSRFTQQDRKEKEEVVRAQFGKEKNKRTVQSLILIATQVVEVGLDITSEALHTEIAPANAVIQRAGRCARFPGEAGEVFLYQPMDSDKESAAEGDAEKEAEEKIAAARYLPYPAALCEATWAGFAARSGTVLDFTGEQAIVDEVHTEGDRQLLAALERSHQKLWEDIEKCMHTGAREQRSSLIRRIDNVSLLATPNPEAIENPFQMQTFGLWRGTAKGIYRRLAALGNPAGGEMGDNGWIMKHPVLEEKKPEEFDRKPRFIWKEVTDGNSLDTLTLVAVNSAYCAYDAEQGFRIVGEEEGGWASPLLPAKPRRRGGPYRYRLESYTDHIGRMLDLFAQRQAAGLHYTARRLEARFGLTDGGIAQAARAAIALHDLGKLDVRWQRWVRRYQAAIGEPIQHPDYMAVHTNWDPRNPAHEAAQKEADRQVARPNHAGESALAAFPLLDLAFGDGALVRAVMTAIARHHSPGVNSHQPYTLHPLAAEAAGAAWRMAQHSAPPSEPLMADAGEYKLEECLIQAGRFEELLTYLLIVRALRLCDQASQE